MQACDAHLWEAEAESHMLETSLDACARKGTTHTFPSDIHTGAMACVHHTQIQTNKYTLK